MDIFSALADPNRRTIIEMLARKGQLSASDIYGRVHAHPPAVSQHLKILRDARLVSVEKKAQQRLYTINPDKFTELESWVRKLQDMWNVRFDRLEKVLSLEKGGKIWKKKI